MGWDGMVVEHTFGDGIRQPNLYIRIARFSECDFRCGGRGAGGWHALDECLAGLGERACVVGTVDEGAVGCYAQCHVLLWA